MITQCCECKRVREDTEWVEPRREFTRDEHVSHGYCPQCADVLMREISLEDPTSGNFSG